MIKRDTRKEGAFEWLKSFISTAMIVILIVTVVAIGYVSIQILPQLFGGFIGQTTSATVDMSSEYDEFHGVYVVEGTLIESVAVDRIEFRGDALPPEECTSNSEALREDYDFNSSVSEAGETGRVCLPESGGTVTAVAINDYAGSGVVVNRETVSPNGSSNN
jgi:hypothetical protein